MHQKKSKINSTHLSTVNTFYCRNSQQHLVMHL